MKKLSCKISLCYKIYLFGFLVFGFWVFASRQREIEEILSKNPLMDDL